MKRSRFVRTVPSVMYLLLVFGAGAVCGTAIDNPCPEGRYKDLSTEDGTCRRLVFDPAGFSPTLIESLREIHVDTDRVLDPARRWVGFDRPRFDRVYGSVSSNLFEVATCTESALRAALDRSRKAGGGQVRLPACTVTVTSALTVPDRTILAGSGMRATILTLPENSTERRGAVVKIESASNVVIRDLAIRRMTPYPFGDLGISVNQSDNVLIERTRLSGVRVAFWVQHSTNFTLRYNEVVGLAKAERDGKPLKTISFGECDQGSGQKATTASCEASAQFQKAAKNPHGSPWSAGFAFYSNLVSGPGRWGSSSASVGEVAGNRYEFGTGQLKIDDGRFVLVHHNVFANVRASVVFRLATEIRDRGTRWLGFFENLLADNLNPGGYLLNFTSGDDVYLLNNRYRNNAGQIALRPRRGVGKNVFMCPDSEERNPLDSSDHSGVSQYVRLLSRDDRLCAPGGAWYLFRD